MFLLCTTAPIVKIQDAVTVKTEDGLTVMTLGYLNKSRTLKNGFSLEICDHSLIAFLYYWENFSDLSVSEELACFSDIVLNDASSAKKDSSLPMQSMGSLKDEKMKAEKKRRGTTNVGMQWPFDKK